MLIFIYGNDSFRVQEKVKQMKQSFAEKFDKSGMNTVVFPSPGKKLDQSEILQSVCSFPFLADRRMVIVRDLISETKAPEAKTWVEGFSRKPESNIVILWESKEPKSVEKKPLFKKLKEMAEVHFFPFEELQGPQLANWISERVKAEGGQIDRAALIAMVERVGADLWQMSHEIEKLIAFASGQMITKEMVEKLVHASFEGQIFALVDAVSKKQSARAIQLLQEERWSGANDFYLLTMLTRQVRLLLSARALLDQNPRATKQELADSASIHPFVASKALEQAKGFELENLKRTHDLLFDYDVKIKTGQLQPDMAVDLVTDRMLR